MPKKHKRPTSPASPTSPAHEKAKVAALAIHFGRYAGITDREQLAGLEGDLPRDIELKIGREVVGTASIDWGNVFRVVMDLVIAGKHGSEMTDDEYIKHVESLERIFNSPSFDTEKSEEVFHRVYHLFAYLPDKLNAAIALLFAEANKDAQITRAKEAGSSNIPSPAAFAKWVAKVEHEFAMNRLPKLRGGDRRTKPAWRNQATLKQYASQVNDRKLLCDCIKGVYDECEGDEGWVTDLKDNATFKKLSAGVQVPALNWAIKAIADEGLPARDREPLSVACELARQELDLPKQKPATLRNYYKTGSAALRQERKKRKNP